jgi:hypothetical protein
MLQIDTWQNAGLAPIATEYIAHLAKERAGDTLSLTEAGDLQVRPATSTIERTIPLLPALTSSSWLDRETGAPRL